MKITAIAVSSINAKITRGDNAKVTAWSSEEDLKFFKSRLSKAKLIVMGSATYDTNKDIIELQKGKLRIVLTKTPQRYSKFKVPGQLEFLSGSPKSVVKNLEKAGIREMLLVGGAKVYSSFMKERLVDEFYLTIEPLIFGRGKALFEEGEYNAGLKLMEVRKLNPKGTILLRYSVRNWR